MRFLVVSFVAVAIPYGFERVFFGRKFGFFAALFWLFVIQLALLFGGEVILESQVGQSLPSWLKSISFAVGALAHLTIGMTPLAAVIAALAFGTVIAATRVLRKLRETPD
ncbi:MULTISPECIES: hypothetical protein [unclassified Mesorhizobium]|uniref:hypothetical protein n=1 Tax=unclassified Mesorhizobium TaxID=325217 RepID=UPI000BB07AB4|nr:MULTISPECIES: hypothetical protein [unclassified Mesorhizobium]TGT56767.1 hypothetical protein EN813_040770 [Mesorhizobium sp. M00.F.Ca.ET.170.01.1.1]AZO08535.1 hypothetical protein EJ074_04875 [Mesorhizobium sp. M3A.F.Ca.ET.080.04.2.1]PBB85410.1 hypothetical protein CK216_17260 [Mesorhizobium sp. WSM3876]RWB71653.1 MAG: hypothetical protein EOQ49_14085 [Mesorhizobium sp.]RWB85094.1 MAG: hypothetical protein EOQ52_22820 [Mesorhizobium sp.]